MIKHNWFIYFLLMFGLSFTACRNNQKQQVPKLDPKEVQDHLAEIHKKNIKVEDRQIDDYLERRGWHFKRTKSGLRYKIYKEGIGMKPQEGQTVKLEYTLNLIRGDVVYDFKKDGPKVFVIGEGDEPSGLHEVVQLMRVGSRAKVILPSYLAYGLIGDENKIPPSATLFYDLYLVEVH
jgi:FKBP-type peptidyl-prolyl cis-trans isomerase